VSASKQKGTGGENEVVAAFAEANIVARRTSPGVNYDIRVDGLLDDEAFQVLATRPDRGQWLATLPLKDLVELLRFYEHQHAHREYPVEVEVKRYRRFSLHSIYEAKFGKKK
jgi:hypothetical protein